MTKPVVEVFPMMSSYIPDTLILNQVIAIFWLFIEFVFFVDALFVSFKENLYMTVYCLLPILIAIG